MGMTGREFALLSSAGNLLPERDHAGFFTQLLHHPPEFTLFPAKIVQGPIASAGFPWNWAQLPHLESGWVDLVT